MAKDFRNIEYHISPDGEENGVRYYACSILNTKQKELIFNKNKGELASSKISADFEIASELRFLKLLST